MPLNRLYPDFFSKRIFILILFSFLSGWYVNQSFGISKLRKKYLEESRRVLDAFQRNYDCKIVINDNIKAKNVVEIYHRSSR